LNENIKNTCDFLYVPNAEIFLRRNKRSLTFDL
jgi:hypothetical protein